MFIGQYSLRGVVMNRSVLHGFLVGAALIVGHVQSALADVAPPVGYVEQCTVAKQEAPGKSCVACANDYRSFVGDAGDKCAQQYGQGYTKMCKSWGASAWTEVWCNGDLDAGTEVTEPAGSCSGCRTASKRTSSAIALLALGALVSTRLLRRRSRD